MRFQIAWVMLLNAQNEYKANKLMNHFEERFAEKTIQLEYSKAYRNAKWIEAKFNTDYQEELTFAEAIFTTLRKVDNIGMLWSVYPPKDNRDRKIAEIYCSFEGICENPKITGIEWIQFVLQTNTKIEYGWNH